MLQRVAWVELQKGAASFVRSELFDRTFKAGMALVEETANYLDGEGRKTSKSLSRSGAIAYASASMRLTTQLMQIASWLLVLRAVRQGDMDLSEARDEKYRLRGDAELETSALREEAPARLLELIESTSQLYARIARLDAELFTDARSDVAERDAAAQQRALQDAFRQ